MRNLKKALALVLALMMTLSLMVTVSASDYPDDNAIEQDEAVSVMSAIGVFNGTDGGKFDPAGNLTRAQAAKIITYMLLDKEVADSLPNTGSKFADCLDGRWYVGAVNYLTDLGIVAGRNETTFDPNGNVNGYEFAKMLLGALGYDSKTERFEGESAWSINIATAARRAGLGEGLSVSTISSVALTREQAAKLAFNTLTATMVYYEGGVVVNDVTVNPTRKEVSGSKTNDYRTADIDDTNKRDDLMQFCEQYFPGLKYNPNYGTPDAFGRTTAGQWENDKEPAYTNMAEPTLVVTDKLSGDALAAQLPSGTTVNGGSLVVKANGADGSTVTTVADVAGLTAAGKTVEIYVSDKKITNVVTVAYTVETIDDITEKDGTTTYKFSSSGNQANTEKAAKVVLEGDVAKGDVVTTARVKGVYYVYPTTSFTGSQTATKSTTIGDTSVQTVTIDGAQYTVAQAAGVAGVSTFSNSADTLTYYVDINGYLVKNVGAVEPDPEYAVIVATVAGSSGTATLDNPTVGTTVNVRAILADGTVEDRTLATKLNESGDLVSGSGSSAVTVCASGSLGSISTVAPGNLNNKLFGYTINKDGKMVLSSVAAPTSAGTAGQVALSAYAGGNNAVGASDQSSVKVLFTNSTTFVLYDQDGDGKWGTEDIKTGISGLSLAVGGVSGIAVVTDNGTASVVFLRGSTQVKKTADEYVFIADPASSYTTVLVDGNELNTWKGIAPDGSEVDVYLDSTISVTGLKSGLYIYDTDKMLAMTDETTVAPAKVDTETADSNITDDDLYANILAKGAEVTDNLLLIGSDYVNITDDTQTVYVDSDLSSVAGNKCLIVMEAAATPKNVATIYVFAAGDKDPIDATIPTTAEIANNATTATITVTGITAGAAYEITATSADTSKATVTVSENTITVTRVGDAPASDETVTVTVTVTPIGTSANTLSAKEGTVTVTLKGPAAGGSGD